MVSAADVPALMARVELAAEALYAVEADPAAEADAALGCCLLAVYVETDPARAADLVSTAARHVERLERRARAVVFGR